MPIRTKLLSGPVISGTQNISRKRRGGEPPHPSDSVGWRLNGNYGRTLVFRSPKNPETWITGEQRQEIITALKIRHNIHTPFRCRKGFKTINNIVEGTIAWFAIPGSCWKRVQRKFTSGEWVALPPRSIDDQI